MFVLKGFLEGGLGEPFDYAQGDKAKCKKAEGGGEEKKFFHKIKSKVAG